MTDISQNKIGVGVGVMILKAGKVLLAKRNSDPEKASSLLDGAGKWSMPGGKLNFQESFEDGLRRETLEETGLTLNNFEFLCVNNDIAGSSHFVTIGFLCNNTFDGEPKNMEPDKNSAWEWFDLNNLPTPIFLPSQGLIDSYKQQRSYIPR